MYGLIEEIQELREENKRLRELLGPFNIDSHYSDQLTYEDFERVRDYFAANAVKEGE